jgi:hypothetical protein
MADDTGLAPKESVIEALFSGPDGLAVGGFRVSSSIPRVRLRRGRPLDPDSLTPIPDLGMLRRPTRVPSVITGVCHFILSQMNLNKGRGEPLEELFPIAVCERPGCGRFFVVQRSGRARFCSERCRSATNKGKLTLPEKAAYMREYRAKKKKKKKP